MLLSQDAMAAILLQFITFRVIRSNYSNTNKAKNQCVLPSLLGVSATSENVRSSTRGH